MKIYLVKQCWSCPAILIPNANEEVCAKMNRIIEDAYTIPEWCPLDEKEE